MSLAIWSYIAGVLSSISRQLFAAATHLGIIIYRACMQEQCPAST